MSKATLRAVAADEKPTTKTAKPQTLEQAIAGGVYLEILEAQQRQMAVDVKDAAGPAKAAMYRQLAIISKEIEQIRAAAKEEAAQDADGATEDEAFDASAV